MKQRQTNGMDNQIFFLLIFSLKSQKILEFSLCKKKLAFFQISSLYWMICHSNFYSLFFFSLFILLSQTKRCPALLNTHATFFCCSSRMLLSKWRNKTNKNFFSFFLVEWNRLFCLKQFFFFKMQQTSKESHIYLSNVRQTYQNKTKQKNRNKFHDETHFNDTIEEFRSILNEINLFFSLFFYPFLLLCLVIWSK